MELQPGRRPSRHCGKPQGNGAKIGGRYVTNAIIIQKSLWGGSTDHDPIPVSPSGKRGGSTPARWPARAPRGRPGRARRSRRTSPRSAAGGLRTPGGAGGPEDRGGVPPPAAPRARPQAVADLGAVRAAEEPAEVVVVELHAAHAGGLAAGHARDGRGDREGDAAGPAAGAADHDLEDNASAASMGPNSSRHGPGRAGSRSARFSAARKRARGHSTAPKLARCSVYAWQSTSWKRQRMRLASSVAKATFEALGTAANIDSPKKTLPIEIP